MKSNRQYRPRFDRLEDRACPALSIHQFGGLLLVSGVPTSGMVSIQETGAHSFTVQDGSAAPISFARVNDLSVSLGRGDDTVDINLGGNAFAGSINANFAGGNNALSIENGTVGSLNIHGGAGGNAVTLGDGSSFKVMHDTIVGLAGNAADAVSAASTANFAGNLTVVNATNVNLDSGSVVGHTAMFLGARAGTTVVDGATVGGNVVFSGNYVVATGQDTLQVNGTVSQNVVYTSSVVNKVGDEVDISANVARNVTISVSGLAEAVNVDSGVTIGGNLTVAFTGGSDTLNVADGSTIAGGALLLLGSGSRQVNFGATVGNNTNALVFALFGGIGNEMVTFTAGANFQGRAVLSLSNFSANTVSFLSAQRFNTFAFTIDGGFIGNNTLNLNGTTGTKLAFRHFATVNP
jgi:hypothetical protein